MRIFHLGIMDIFGLSAIIQKEFNYLSENFNNFAPSNNIVMDFVIGESAGLPAGYIPHWCIGYECVEDVYNRHREHREEMKMALLYMACRHHYLSKTCESKDRMVWHINMFNLYCDLNKRHNP